MELKHAPLPIGDPGAGLKNAKILRGVTEKDFKRRFTAGLLICTGVILIVVAELA